LPGGIQPPANGGEKISAVSLYFRRDEAYLSAKEAEAG
jgi:hypothetical protein